MILNDNYDNIDNIYGDNMSPMEEDVCRAIDQRSKKLSELSKLSLRKKKIVVNHEEATHH